jgi:acyl carrier protein
MTPTFAELVSLIQATFGQKHLQIDADSVASEVPGWDSLNHVTLMLAIEQRFHVFIQPDQSAKLANVGELYKLIVERREQEKAP